MKLAALHNTWGHWAPPVGVTLTQIFQRYAYCSVEDFIILPLQIYDFGESKKTTHFLYLQNASYVKISNL